MPSKVNCASFFKFYLIVTLSCGKSNAFTFKVVGIFDCDVCAPAVAAKLAVDNFNDDTKSFQLSYTHISEETVIDDWNYDLQVRLRDAIIITGNTVICEFLARLDIWNMNRFLVCYNPATKGTMENMRLRKNAFLSQPNPKAFIPCVHSLIRKIQEFSNRAGTRKLFPVAVSLILEGNHTSHQVEEALLNNLSSGKIRVNRWWLEDPHSISSFHFHRTDAEAHVVVAALNVLQARNLLCELYRKKCLGENVFLVFLGPLEKHWIDEAEDTEKDATNSCDYTKILKAAEGHFLLTFPNWDTSKENLYKTETIKKDIMRSLRKSGLGVFPDFYTDAPFVYDSVWALAGAINRSVSSIIWRSGDLGRRQMLLQKELEKPFIGVTGNFSLTKEGVRSSSSAIVSVNRFDNGTYVEVGKHFNANLTFYPSLAGVIHSRRDGDMEECVDDTVAPSSYGVVMIVSFVLLALIFILLGCTICYQFNKKLSKIRTYGVSNEMWQSNKN